MRLRLGCRFEHEATSPTPAVVLVEPHLDAAAGIVAERWSSEPAVEATSNTFLDPLTTGALWLGIGALVVAAIAALTGPYGWAIRLRTGTVRLARSVGSAVSGKAEDPATAAWIAANLDKLRIAGAVVGVRGRCRA